MNETFKAFLPLIYLLTIAGIMVGFKYAEIPVPENTSMLLLGAGLTRVKGFSSAVVNLVKPKPKI